MPTLKLGTVITIICWTKIHFCLFVSLWTNTEDFKSKMSICEQRADFQLKFEGFYFLKSPLIVKELQPFLHTQCPFQGLKMNWTIDWLRDSTTRWGSIPFYFNGKWRRHNIRSLLKLLNLHFIAFNFKWCQCKLGRPLKYYKVNLSEKQQNI